VTLALHHLAVVVSDLARAEKFYCDVLGLHLVRRWNDDAGAHRSTWVSLGSAFLAIERATRSGPMRADDAPGHHCVALAIREIERADWRVRLGAAGVAIERESPYTMYFRDPDGNLVALSHYPEERR
jgi:catechol 2,3-dioxygenase-like lactoylglutathione lyase family enzyme